MRRMLAKYSPKGINRTIEQFRRNFLRSAAKPDPHIAAAPRGSPLSPCPTPAGFGHCQHPRALKSNIASRKFCCILGTNTLTRPRVHNVQNSHIAHSHTHTLTYKPPRLVIREQKWCNVHSMLCVCVFGECTVGHDGRWAISGRRGSLARAERAQMRSR